MADHLLLYRSDGGISVIQMTRGSYSAKEILVWEKANAPVKIVSWRELRGGELPGREFRDAWTYEQRNGPVKVDMVKARAIHLSRMHEAVSREKRALVYQYQQAVLDENEARKEEIRGRYRTLRDAVLPDLNRHDNPQALHADWPDYLGGRV